MSVCRWPRPSVREATNRFRFQPPNPLLCPRLLASETPKFGDASEMAPQPLRILDDAWLFSSASAALKCTAPILHGTLNGKPFHHQLSFDAVSRESRSVPLPGKSGEKFAAIAQLGTTQIPDGGPTLDWELLLVPQPTGVRMRLSLKVAAESRGDSCRLEHITLATVTPSSPSAQDDSTIIEPPPIVRRSSSSTVAATIAATAASVTAAVTLTPLAAAAVTALAAAAPIATYRYGSASSGGGRAAFLINGWQSFAFAGAIRSDEAQPVTTMPYFSSAFHTGATPPEGDNSTVGLVSDLFGMLMWDRDGGDGGSGGGEGGGVLLGFLTADCGVGGVMSLGENASAATLFVEQPTLLASVSTSIETDWAIILPIQPIATASTAPARALHSYAEYMDAVAAHSAVPAARAGRGKPPDGGVGEAALLSDGATAPAVFGRPTPVGWCSWYCHGPKVSAPLMMSTIEKLGAAKASGELPLELVQLDDGWQSCWGDWLTPHASRFPKGLYPITAAAKAQGLLAGLWMAPAALTSGSKVMAEHPEWILKMPNGKPLACGFTAPGIWLYALDVTHPGALDYIRKVIRTAVHDWGFAYLKLDFLHTAAMPGAARHDPNVSRATALHNLMKAVREEAGEETFILACGAPLGPCIKHVDGLRVSADAAPSWLPSLVDVYGLRWICNSDRTNLPAARNMVRNVGVRLPFGGRVWRNDPDCLILREEGGVEFSLGQAQALASVAALSAGAMIFSDPPGSLAPPRLAVLQRVLPPLPRAAVAVDLMRREIPCQLVVPLAGSDRDEGEGVEALGSWWLVGLFNWSATEEAAAGGEGAAGVPVASLLAAATAAADGRSGRLPTVAASMTSASGWHSFDFWSGTYTWLPGPSPVLQPPIVPHGCGCLLALRPMSADGQAAQLIGTDVHLSCGLEVCEWKEREAKSAATAANPYPSKRVLEIRLNAGRKVDAPKLWLSLPGTKVVTPPEVEADCVADFEIEAAVLPPPVWVAEPGIWCVQLAPIGADGRSRAHRVWFG